MEKENSKYEIGSALSNWFWFTRHKGKWSSRRRNAERSIGRRGFCGIVVVWVSSVHVEG